VHPYGFGLAYDNRTFVPRLDPACNVRSLPITPAEAFVLSRIDGFTSASDLGIITGLGDDVLATLERLHKLGAILNSPQGSAPEPPPRSPPPAATRAETQRPAASSVTSSAPRQGAPGVRLSVGVPPSNGTLPVSAAGARHHEGAALPAKVTRYPAAELDEDVDIEPERRKRILDLFYALDDLTHYDLLGVSATAEKKQIKASYFQLAQEFHPDRYFRKRVGNFKTKLEVLFKRITDAHDVLTRKATRAEYDATLESMPQPQLREHSSRPPAPSGDAPPRRSAAPLAQPAQVVVTESPPPADDSADQHSSPPPDNTPEGGGSVRPGAYQIESRPLTAEEARARRAAFASRLSSGRPPPRAGSSAPAPLSSTPPSPMSGEAARDTLRKMSVARQIETQRAQSERYLTAAEAAVASGDAVAAANAFGLALSLSPDDEQLARKQKEWAARAATVLSVGYVKQGDAEAARSQWADAARSFAKALAGNGEDPWLLQKAATALVNAEGDLHQAAEYARRAVGIAPARLSFRLTLAEVYLAANLTLSARRELEAAAKIDPNDGRLKVLLKRLG
jgi:curved DNA-binding protein CbpA/Tfp pilus assembly protein PilF